MKCPVRARLWPSAPHTTPAGRPALVRAVPVTDTVVSAHYARAVQVFTYIAHWTLPHRPGGASSPVYRENTKAQEGKLPKDAAQPGRSDPCRDRSMPGRPCPEQGQCRQQPPACLNPGPSLLAVSSLSTLVLPVPLWGWEEAHTCSSTWLSLGPETGQAQAKPTINSC